MYQRGRSTMLALEDFVLPYYDGDTTRVVEWVEQLEACVRRFSPPPPFTFILSTIRSHLIDEAAKWWDAQKVLPNDLQTVRNMLIARFTVGADYARTSMTRLISSTLIGPVMEVLTRVDSTQSITTTTSSHRDYLIILKTLSLMDCPVVVDRLRSLSLENELYGWRDFKRDVQNCYTLEVAQQAQICQPFIGYGGRIRFGDDAVYHSRYNQLQRNHVFCVVCMSIKHRTDDCHMLRDVLALQLY